MKKTIIIILAMVLLPIYVYSQIVGGAGGGGYAIDIEDGLIVNADVNAAAAIDATKIADGTTARITAGNYHLTQAWENDYV